MDSRGEVSMLDPDVLAAVVAASRDLVEASADAVERARRVREQSQELVRQVRSQQQSP